MWLNEDAPIRKRDLVLAKPTVNAPGMLGFAPDPHTMPFLEHLGAFITHPISRYARQPAKNRCCLPFPGGFLLHTGLPNPGIDRAIKKFRHRWANAPLPIIVHLLAESPRTLTEVVRKLEGLENIMAVELGLPPNCDSAALREFLEAAAGELPTLVSIHARHLPVLQDTLTALQPAAVHLQPPRGVLPDAKGDLVSGRLYGPAVFPLTLSAAKALIDSDLSLIAGCGAFHAQQIQILREIGITAVSLNAATWQINSAGLFEN